MINRHTLARTTLSVALLSALVLAQPAHAGLLGNAGFGAAASPRSFDMAGSATGQLQRDASPRRIPSITDQTSTAKQGSVAVQGAAAAQTRNAEAGAAVAGQASRADHSVGVDAAVQASGKR